MRLPRRPWRRSRTERVTPVLRLGAIVDHSSIHGIECRRLGDAARLALEEVLARIRSAQPEDYQRLLRVVKEVVPLSPEETEDGTQGEWKAESAKDWETR